MRRAQSGGRSALSAALEPPYASDMLTCVFQSTSFLSSGTDANTAASPVTLGKEEEGEGGRKRKRRKRRRRKKHTVPVRVKSLDLQGTASTARR